MGTATRRRAAIWRGRQMVESKRWEFRWRFSCTYASTSNMRLQLISLLVAEIEFLPHGPMLFLFYDPRQRLWVKIDISQNEEK